MSAVGYSAAEAAVWANGSLVRGSADTRFDSSSIDTRTLDTGSLFFAIRGPNHDAHGFLAAASEAGASGFVVERNRGDRSALPESTAVIEVDDTTVALGAVAHCHRSSFDGSLVGLSGSSGKTTTKEMCASVLSQQAPCLATRGNLNNDYGVPLTLLQREPQHELAVVEMGMNHRGEIAVLAEIAKPTIGVLTNIGTAHIEHLGSREEIAAEKGDLFAALPENGLACTNLDDEHVARQAKRARCPALSYARSLPADVTSGDVTFDAGRFVFAIQTPDGSFDAIVHGLSDTAVINALAATAVGLAAGLNTDCIAEGLASYEPIRGRMTPIALSSGATLIDDTYNANPDSMRASLDSLRALAGGGRAIAVVGDMGELGGAADSAHRDLGSRAARLRLDALFAYGAYAELVRDSAVAAGLDRANVAVITSHAEAAERVSEMMSAGDWILVKGSRAAQMERVVHALEKSEGR
ncbi:MAG: UDP-N-acetylmuramoyl-tripeptide--D-alanyl-D-alanine ligase [Myxococcota bacterium]|nr:UDP-N-acetylmuramoyl-tripeptide--D-alanyl-D-alanine ligase [Myxococcota bacterium]